MWREDIQPEDILCLGPFLCVSRHYQFAIKKMIESEGEEVGIRYVPSLGVSGGLEIVFCEMQILCVVQVLVSFPWSLVDGCWLFNFLSLIKRTKSGIHTPTLREVSSCS